MALESTKVHREQGAARLVVESGGSLDVESGGEIDVESGASLKLAGTAVTSTAAEINILDGVTSTAAELTTLADVVAGTVTASKAVVVGANKNVDVFVVADGGLALGAGAGTAVTSTAAELNILDGVTATAAELNISDGIVSTFTFVPASAGANVSEVTITAKDAAGSTVGSPVIFDWWLSDAATGAGLTGTAASGTVAVKSASGVDLNVYTAKKHTLVQAQATGIYILEITDSGKTGYYVCVRTPAGVVTVSAQLVTGDYGS